MSTALTPPPTVPAGRFGGLLRAEVHRFGARRFIRVLAALTLLGWVTVLVISLLSFQSPTPEGLAAARQQQQESIALSNQGREQCLADPALPTDGPPEVFCGDPATEENTPLSLFLSPAPFSLSEDAEAGAISVAAVSAALAFLVGATFVGAEWSSRSMVALLFWETRRPRVMAAKLLVTGGAVALLGVVMQALWLGVATLLQSVDGDGSSPPAGFWPDLLGTSGRGALLAVFAGLLGFGLTNLLRNTGAATGVAFVYLAIAENAVRALRPAWQPWLLTNNAAALVQQGGLTLSWSADSGGSGPFAGFEQVTYQLSSGQAVVFLTVVTAVVVGIGVVLFSRRDLH